jgi:hypothetical protein
MEEVSKGKHSTKNKDTPGDASKLSSILERPGDVSKNSIIDHD